MTPDLDRLGSALSTLSDDVRATLELVVVDGLGYRDIARLLDEQEEAIAARIRDGLNHLRRSVGAGFAL